MQFKVSVMSVRIGQRGVTATSAKLVAMVTRRRVWAVRCATATSMETWKSVLVIGRMAYASVKITPRAAAVNYARRVITATQLTAVCAITVVCHVGCYKVKAVTSKVWEAVTRSYPCGRVT